MGENTVDIKRKFTEIYDNNSWGSDESRSGTGSEMLVTVDIRENLPILFDRYNINSILDIGCGDFNWMKEVVGSRRYVGVDIVESLIERNNAKYGSETVEFVCKNILEADNTFFCGYDCVIIRDVFVHLSFDSINSVLKQIRLGNIPYMFVTNFIGNTRNQDIKDGMWRPLNMYIHPFNIGRPIEIIASYVNHYDMDGLRFFDKTLTMWRTPLITTDKHHSFVNNIVIRQIRNINPNTVVDIGCGDGYWGKVVKTINPSIHLTGIELSSKWYDHCATLGVYDRLINDDLLYLINLKGDLIIFGDVLEHIGKNEAMIAVKHAVDNFKFVIINTPIGFQEQNHEDELEIHRCGLTLEDFNPYAYFEYRESGGEHPVFNILLSGYEN